MTLLLNPKTFSGLTLAIYLGFSSMGVAQTTTPTDTQVTETTTELVTPKTEASTSTSAPTDVGHVGSTRFEPSVEVSEDLSISFPIDI
jgi:hypothetical protein